MNGFGEFKFCAIICNKSKGGSALLQLHKNIKIFYLATILTTLAASLPHAVLTVLLFAKGLSLTQIMLVQATYSLVILVSEYPSGLLADLYSADCKK